MQNTKPHWKKGMEILSLSAPQKTIDLIMSNPITEKNLYLKIAELLQSARLSVVRAVNQTMVYTYYEIGRMIVEEEQQGKERAEYVKQV